MSAPQPPPPPTEKVPAAQEGVVLKPAEGQKEGGGDVTPLPVDVAETSANGGPTMDPMEVNEGGDPDHSKDLTTVAAGASNEDVGAGISGAGVVNQKQASDDSSAQESTSGFKGAPIKLQEKGHKKHRKDRHDRDKSANGRGRSDKRGDGKDRHRSRSSRDRSPTSSKSRRHSGKEVSEVTYGDHRAAQKVAEMDTKKRNLSAASNNSNKSPETKKTKGVAETALKQFKVPKKTIVIDDEGVVPPVISLDDDTDHHLYEPIFSSLAKMEKFRANQPKLAEKFAKEGRKFALPLPNPKQGAFKAHVPDASAHGSKGKKDPKDEGAKNKSSRPSTSYSSTSKNYSAAAKSSSSTVPSKPKIVDQAEAERMSEEDRVAIANHLKGLDQSVPTDEQLKKLRYGESYAKAAKGEERKDLPLMMYCNKYGADKIKRSISSTEHKMLEDYVASKMMDDIEAGSLQNPISIDWIGLSNSEVSLFRTGLWGCEDAHTQAWLKMTIEGWRTPEVKAVQAVQANGSVKATKAVRAVARGTEQVFGLFQRNEQGEGGRFMHFIVGRGFKNRSKEVFMQMLDMCNPQFRGKGVVQWEGFCQLPGKSGDLLVILIVDKDYQSCIKNAEGRLSLGIKKVGVKFV